MIRLNARDMRLYQRTMTVHFAAAYHIQTKCQEKEYSLVVIEQLKLKRDNESHRLIIQQRPPPGPFTILQALLFNP